MYEIKEISIKKICPECGKQGRFNGESEDHFTEVTVWREHYFCPSCKRSWTFNKDDQEPQNNWFNFK